jgi:cell division protein DivIC
MEAQSTANKSKSVKRRYRLVLIVLCLFFIFAIVRSIEQEIELRERSKQLDLTNSQLEETRRLNIEAKKEMDRLNDPEYRQEMIRKQLQYSKENETVFDAPKQK